MLYNFCRVRISYPSRNFVLGTNPPGVYTLKNGTINLGYSRLTSPPTRNVLYPVKAELYWNSDPTVASILNNSPPLNVFLFLHPNVTAEPVRLLDLVLALISARNDFLGNGVR